MEESPNARAADQATPGNGAAEGPALAQMPRDLKHNATLLGLAVSLFVHTALLLLLAATWFGRSTGGDAGVGDEIQFAVMNEVELNDLLNERLSVEQTELEHQSLTRELDASLAQPLLADFGESEADLEALRASTGAGASALDQRGSNEAALSGGGQAKFFGIEARGSRFAYLIDVSGSMAEQNREIVLKQALIASIENLNDESKFSIVLYNDRAMSLTGEAWIRATDAARGTARQRIGAVTSGGGTNPISALEFVRTLKPLPDAIYFMTDGEFAAEMIEPLLRAIMLLERPGEASIPVHAITFISRESESLMRRIASLSGGSYTHVEGPTQ